MTTYGYVRVSSFEQTIGTSMEDQERMIRGCAMMRGINDLVMVADPDVSGYSVWLADRPAGGKMIAAVQKGDLIIASKMDRIFRNASDALTSARNLSKRGVDLILCDMGIEPVTHSGASKMFFGMLAMFAEFERDRIAERFADGRRGKKARGGHIGGSAPYGYQVSGTGVEAELVEYIPEQRIIRRIKDLFDAGTGPTGIMRILNAEGFTNREGKPFAKMTVQRILGRVEMEKAA